jgi:LPS-assembly protein
MKSRTFSIAFLVLLSVLAAGENGAVFAQELPKKVPVKVKADKLDYDRATDVYVAEGNVRIEQENITLEADRLMLDNRTGRAVAEGRVYLQQKGEILRAEKLEININTRAGIIHNGEIFMTKDNYHMKGAVIERKSDTVFRLEQGTFTTCDEGEWYLKADEINVDLDRYATGRGVSFNMAGLPVFYAPYFLFPVRRQTGLLIPQAGYSSSEGFFMRNAFFWSISDYQDMTVISDYRAKHGIGTGVEYRYVNSRDSQGKLWYNYFDEYNNWIATHAAVPRTLWEFKFQHQEEIAEDLSARADVNLVSDFFYYRDIEKKLEVRSIPYLDSNAFYVERWDTASLYLLGQYSTDLAATQDLTVRALPDGTFMNEVLKPDDDTVQKLPELRYNIFQEHVAGPLWLSFDGSVVNFAAQKKPGLTPLDAGADLQRADLDPRLTGKISLLGLTLTPYAGYRATYYSKSLSTMQAQQRDQNGNIIVDPDTNEPILVTVYEMVDKPTDRTYAYVGAALNTRISRIYGSDDGDGIGRVRHSIEPTISYDYIPHVDTADIPQYDSHDIATQRNLVTFSLINRLTAHYRDAAASRTFEMMLLRLAQSYDILEAQTVKTGARPRSELFGEIAVKTPRLLTLSASGKYNTYLDSLSESSESIAFRTKEVQFDVTHRYLRDPKTQFLIGGVGLTLGGWNLHAGVWHDLEKNETTQEEYRAYRQSQCWGLGISYIQRPGDTQYLLTLELKGLGTMKF